MYDKMQALPTNRRVNKKNYKSTRMLTLLVAPILFAASVLHCQAWQFDPQMTTHHQMFPVRHANIASDFYQPPGGGSFLYNQPLNSLGPQQQFLTPTSSNAQAQAQAAAAAATAQPVSSAVNPFNAAILVQGNRIAPAEASSAPIQSAPSSDTEAHGQSISVRDISQQQQAALKVNDSTAPTATSKQDHNIVASPSPLGKILDVVVRETATALSDISHASKHQASASTKDANKLQAPVAVEPAQTSARTTESGGSDVKQAPAATTTTTTTTGTGSNSGGKRASQQLKPTTKKSGEKSPLNSIEQQIINQHARATSYATLNGRRHEHQQQKEQEKSSAQQQQQSQPQQLLRLLPIKHRGDIKIFANLLSSLNHNSASASAGGADSSSSASSSSSSANSSNSPILSALLDNFKSGITSRSSIVKAAISDNKLARTLSTVGKTIGGNKYVAGAGAAAALAALGLTVSKFLSPYVLAGQYSKLGAGGPTTAGFENIMASSSMLHPSYDGLDRNPIYFQQQPGSNQYVPSDSMLEAATNQQPLGMTNQYASFGALDQSTINQALATAAAAAAAGNNQQVDSLGDIFTTYRAQHPFRPLARPSAIGAQKDVFAAAGNGHYSNFYENQAQYDAQGGNSGGDFGSATLSQAYEQNSQQQPQQQYGTYISGAPSSAGTTPEHYVSYSPAPSSSSSLSNDGSSSGYSGYEQAASTSNQFADQIAPSASSDTPTYVSGHQEQARFQQSQSQPQLQQQPQYDNYFASKSPGNSRVASGVASASHRSGAVMLKLDEATRNLIKQKLQAEIAGAPHQLNYNDFSSSSLQRHNEQQQQQHFARTDQSSGVELALAAQQQPLLTAADSSENYPTLVEFPASGATQTIKASRFNSAMASGNAGGASASSKQSIIESNYAPATRGAPQQQGQQRQFVIEGQRNQQQQQQLEQRQTVSGANNPTQQAYNSIRPQMQTRRNELVTSGDGQSAAAGTYDVQVIRPKTMKQQQQQQQQQLVDLSSDKQQFASQATTAEQQQQQQQRRRQRDSSYVARREWQQAAAVQPQQVALVPIVGTSPLSKGPLATTTTTTRDQHHRRHHEESSSEAEWKNFVSAQQSHNGDKKQVAVDGSRSSLDSSPSVADLVAAASNDQISESNSRVENSQHRAISRTPTRAASQGASKLATVRSSVANTDKSWQTLPALDQQSLIKDYEILAAQQQQQLQERPADNAMQPPQPMLQANKAHNDIREATRQHNSDSQQQQQQDELLQVASNMRANLIQLTTSGQGGGVVGANAGGAYQLDNGEENDANVNSFDNDKKESERNKLIEARANTNNTDGGRGSGDRALSSSSQQHVHNQRHRSQSNTSEQQEKRAQQQQAADDFQKSATETSAGDNVLLELLSNENADGLQQQQQQQQQQRQEQKPPATTATTGADQTPSLEHKQAQVGETGKIGQQRAFRGIVAGGIGADR